MITTALSILNQINIRPGDYKIKNIQIIFKSYIVTEANTSEICICRLPPFCNRAPQNWKNNNVYHILYVK